MKDKRSLIKAAKAFVIVGALLMMILSLMSLVGRVMNLPFYPALQPVSLLYLLVSLFGGAVALALSSKTGSLPSALILISIGIGGNGLGGFLVLIGGVTGLITRLT
jgi:hypothetical protein